MRLPAIALTLAISSSAFVGEQPGCGPHLEGFDYPWPVQLPELVSQRQSLQMAYLDVTPTAPGNGKAAVLLHGKNFCAAIWETTIADDD